MTVDPGLREMMTSVLAGHGPSTPVRPLWDTLRSVGLDRLTTPVERGGSGAGWPEAAALLRTAAFHGVPLPLAENDLLAGRLLQEADLPTDDALRTACVLDGEGTAHAVPWARAADRVTALLPADGAWHVLDVPSSSVRIAHGTNLAGEPRDDVRVSLDSAQATPVGAHVVEDFMLRGALARSLQMTGAMERTLRLSVDHAKTRTQFGRPLARFQAVQHLVADIAAEAALATAAADAAVRGRPALFDVAVAKSAAANAAATIVRNAHQVHGAIGTTIEHPLHAFTLALTAWGSEFGSAHDWNERLMTTAVAADDDLWRLITDASR
ncbi:acyl-CoA dehydrogenase family protein [Actinomadura sp. 7K507]|uniref:acyl-CoA dehydrogenase family protein n=1 Tax=Actinomadura sp. 7K507 TaxID=2530365 RepID=UPI00104DD6BF|nr:acyl-CoA dehydrogenase family protein [Actinomadura sp. 7K507]TDC97619.1 acyl-CoA dehydrogenase [Actinomadura sp. 7K507]